MANTTSATKAARQAIKRTANNKAGRTRMRGEVRHVEEAIAKGDKASAQKALQAAEPVLARTAKKGLIHKRTAARKVSRLTLRVRAMA